MAIPGPCEEDAWSDDEFDGYVSDVEDRLSVQRCETKVKCMRERVEFRIMHAHLVALNQLEMDHRSTSFV